MNLVDAFVLIGGGSKRLGRDKAFVELGGRTLAQRAHDTITEAAFASRIYYVAASPDQFSNRVGELMAPVIFDEIPNCGPIGALSAALSIAQTEWILLLACDLPFVSADFLKRLISKQSGDSESIVARQLDGKLQPLCGFYKVAAARKSVINLRQRNSSPPIREVLGLIATRIVTFDEYSDLANAATLLANINTSHDLEAALRTEP